MRVFAKIDVQHQSLASLNEHLDLLRLRIPHQRFSIDDEGCERHSAYLEKGKLFLHILLQEVGVTLLPRWYNLGRHPACGTESIGAELYFLEAIDSCVEIQIEIKPGTSYDDPSSANLFTLIEA
ncbi:uncharacterized protein TrAFT101_008968 [Trichoderma asperellum]|uniref:uncharacterized protein n=1 Tax=Trichoderma asperellum TaxID=101201 RepID=UPI003330E392|nr:hypothetical protein TrAFT101_008968 [Trichoderma asperellum]